MKRIAFIAILIGALILGGTGCMNNKRVNINDAALAYMEEKYGEEFEYVAPWGVGYIAPKSRQILVSCASLPDEQILVVVSGDGDSETYRDNYMDYYFEGKTREYISDIAGKYFTSHEVEVEISYAPAPEGITLDTSFDDYICDTGSITYASLDIPSTDEDTIIRFAEDLMERGVYFAFSITILDTNEGINVHFTDRSDGVALERRTPR